MKKVAILIDGGFFLKRINALDSNLLKNEFNIESGAITPQSSLKLLHSLIQLNLKFANQFSNEKNHMDSLYRVFFYDAEPYDKREHFPISGKSIDFKKSPQALFRKELFDLLRVQYKFALRLGEVKNHSSWQLKNNKSETFIKGLKEGESFSQADFIDDDFQLNFKQAGVDMRVGVDITTLALKKLVDTIVLVSGEGDFAPAAKLARTEGISFFLDIMGSNISVNLIKHVDGIFNSFFKPINQGLLKNANWHNISNTVKT